MIRIEELTQKLLKAQKEIGEFQQNCPHSHQKIKFDEKNSANWYCMRCSLQIRIPSQQELENWISS